MPEELLYGSLVTDTGSVKLANAAKNGEKIDIVHFQVGDANGEYYLPTHDQTALRHVVYQSDIVAYDISPEDDKQLLIKCQIPSEAGYFVVREWGLVDSDGDLIAVANVSEIEVVPFKTGEILNLNLEVYIQFDNSEIGAVNITVRPTNEELIKEEVLKHVDFVIKQLDKTVAIKNERIDEILKLITGREPTYIVGEAIPDEVLDRILDDDPLNDPEYKDEAYSIGDEVLSSIMGVDPLKS